MQRAVLPVLHYAPSQQFVELVFLTRWCRRMMMLGSRWDGIAMMPWKSCFLAKSVLRWTECMGKRGRVVAMCDGWRKVRGLVFGSGVFYLWFTQIHL